MSDEYEAALSELAEEWGPLTRQTMVMLSGPTPGEFDAFVARWPEINVERRREVIARMVELAEEWFDLDYVALFRHCLRDGDPVVRRHAVEGLWEDESASLIEPLLELLSSDPDVGVRAAAAISLGRFVLQAECAELSPRRAARIREALERVIADTGEEIKLVRRAVESLAYIHDDRVRQIIDWAYDHDDQSMRESAVFAMGRSADTFWADTVLAELHDSSPAMRYEAARACGELQLKRAVESLIRLVGGPDREVQEMAVWALGQIGGERARESLAQWAEGEDEVLRLVAIEALDELEFATRPMDLFVQDADDIHLTEIEFGAEEEERELTEDGAETAYDDWEDDFLDLDEAGNDVG